MKSLVIWRMRLLKWLIMLVIPIGCAILASHYGVSFSVVQGTSMQPTLHDGDRLLVNKFQFLFSKPKFGDVITFRDPLQSNRYLVKRVVGVPGDVITIRDRVLYRNGTQVKEEYIDSEIEDGKYEPITVKPGTVFVMGDNRNRYASRDSRYASIGLVPFGLIDGKVELILWRPSLMAHL